MSDACSHEENIRLRDEGNTEVEADNAFRRASETTGDVGPQPASTACKRVHTGIACAAYFVACLSGSIIGPTLLDLELITNADTKELSMVFMFRGALGMIGSLMWGPIYDRVDHYLLLAIALFTGFVLQVFFLWCTTLAAVLAVLSAMGILTSSLVMGTHLMCVRIWGDEVGPILQLLNLMGIFGYVVSPFLAIPFLAINDTASGTLSEGSAFNVNGSATEVNTSTTQTPSSVNNPTSLSVNSTTVSPSVSLQTVPSLNSSVSTLVPYCFLLIGLLYLAVAVFMLMAWLMSTNRKVFLRDGNNEQQSQAESGASIVYLSILFFIFNIFYGGLEIGYTGLLTTFAVKQLGWSKESGSLVTGLLQGSNALVTAIAIPAAKYAKPDVIVGLDITIITAANLLMILLVNKFDFLLWIGTALVGVGYATIVPSSITWVNTFRKVTGTFNSAYWCGFFTGYTAIPVLAGHLFTEYSPMCYLYVMLACCIGMALLFTALYAHVRTSYLRERK